MRKALLMGGGIFSQKGLRVFDQIPSKLLHEYFFRKRTSSSNPLKNDSSHNRKIRKSIGLGSAVLSVFLEKLSGRTNGPFALGPSKSFDERSPHHPFPEVAGYNQQGVFQIVEILRIILRERIIKVNRRTQFDDQPNGGTGSQIM